MQMIIGFVQYAVQFGNIAANFARVNELLNAPGHVDLVVLPELAFTGYEFVDAAEAANLAEDGQRGETADFLRELSSRLNAVVIAGYPECANGKIFNSAMMASGGEILSNYRKIHLFSREKELFTPGDAPAPVVNSPAGRIGMMICFDWFFPEVARSLALSGAQIIAHPSNLVLPWCQRAMFARSVENRVLSITANRIGTESRAGRRLTFTGQSQVLGVDGAVLTSAQADEECVKTVHADISAADDKQLNPLNDLFADRRPGLYRLD